MATTPDGITLNDAACTWADLVQAALQPDTELACQYQAIIDESVRSSTGHAYYAALHAQRQVRDTLAVRAGQRAESVAHAALNTTAHDNAALRAEILDLRNQRGERSDADIDARIAHLRGEIR